mgnify:CR=1 FL=1
MFNKINRLVFNPEIIIVAIAGYDFFRIMSEILGIGLLAAPQYRIENIHFHVLSMTICLIGLVILERLNQFKPDASVRDDIALMDEKIDILSDLIRNQSIIMRSHSESIRHLEDGIVP